MSSAQYPLGMKTYNNYVNQGGYKSWKGSGNQSNPVGITASNIRPLTNNDAGNVFPTGFGLARPMKHYRKGRIIPVHTSVSNQYSPNELSAIDRNLNRFVKSSTGASLGGGAGGTSMVSQLIGQPGSFAVKANTKGEQNEIQQQAQDCRLCEGITLVSDYYPNNSYLTDNPEPKTQTPTFCCNEEKKARRRVVYASTNLKKNYFTTMQEYRENRCKTYDQRVFNFQNNAAESHAEILEVYKNNPFIDKNALQNAKPGSPLSFINTYVGNCQPNGEIAQTNVIAVINRIVDILLQQGIMNQTQLLAFIQQSPRITTMSQFVTFLNVLPQPQKDEALEVYNNYVLNPYLGLPINVPSNSQACKLVVYKPNNYQYATQGAVSSSTRTFKQNVTTIEKNVAGYNRDQKVGIDLGMGQALNASGQPAIPYLYKNKVQGCNPEIQIHFQNHNSCRNTTGKPTQPAFSSNHYTQSPRNPLM